MEVGRLPISASQRGKLIAAGYTTLSSFSSLSPSHLARGYIFLFCFFGKMVIFCMCDIVDLHIKISGFDSLLVSYQLLMHLAKCLM